MSVVAERLPAPSSPRRGRRRIVRARTRSGLHNRLEYVLLRAAAALLGALPLGAALRVGELGAWLAYAVDRPHRRIGMRNLAIAFPEKSTQIGRASCRERVEISVV